MSSSCSFPLRWIIGSLLFLASSAHAQDADSEYGASPVDPELVAAARAGVMREDAPGEAGRLRHRFTFADGTVVAFEDRPKAARDTAKRERVVSHVGQHSAAKEPEETFAAAGASAGLSSEAIAALRYVSRHEGGFDAINTWDSARFSWGFIQFAGGYGLRPMLAHFKSKSPETFHNLLAIYGIDVLPDAAGKPEPIFVDADGEMRRGAEAEQAFGDDPLLIAAFIRAGSVPEVKQRQLEAAIQGYARPALMAQFQGQLLSKVLCSPQGLAMLMDRQVHEGNVGRLRWALEHACVQQDVSDPARWPELEGRVLDLVVRDADARAQVVGQIERANGTLQHFLMELTDPEDLAPVTDPNMAEAGGSILSEARSALEMAAWQCDYRMIVGPRRDSTRQTVANALEALRKAQQEEMATPQTRVGLEGVVASLKSAIAPFRYEHLIRNRLTGIRRSTLAGPAITPDIEPQSLPTGITSSGQ